jgi:uncharacterized RDD family membrane protein YckC
MNRRSSLLVPRSWRRMAARLIDIFVRTGLELPFWIQALQALLTPGESVRIHLTWFAYLIVTRLSYEAVPYYLWGATPGKYLLDLRVIDRDHPGNGLGLWQCYLRTLTGQFSFFVGWAFYATALFRYDRSHWMDLWASTRVIALPQEKAISGNHRQARRPIRWVIGGLMFVFSLFSGFEQAKIVVSGVSFDSEYLEIDSSFFGMRTDVESVTEP